MPISRRIANWLQPKPLSSTTYSNMRLPLQLKTFSLIPMKRAGYNARLCRVLHGHRFTHVPDQAVSSLNDIEQGVRAVPK